MPMNHIPGFYYDESKGKYFKILPNHVAPEGSLYSRDSVQRKADDEVLRKKVNGFNQKAFKQKIQLSRILLHPLGGGVAFERERGVVPCTRDAVIDAWGQGLKKTRILDGSNKPALFAYDETTRTFIFAANKNDMSVRANEIVTTELGSSQHASVHLSRLLPPGAGDFMTRRQYDGDSSILLRSPRPITLWASSPRPMTTRSDFALGTSSGVTLVVEDQARWSFDLKLPLEAGEGRSEVMAVEWLGENIVASGRRGGQVGLWDVRSESIAATSWPILHPSMINHVRKINDNKILVAGIENQMCVYDMRHLPRETTGKGVTKPLIRFEAYENRQLNALTVGCDVLGDLIAVGMNVGRVGLFDARTGEDVAVARRGMLGGKKMKGSVLGGKRVIGLARSLRFVDGDGGPKLFLTTGKGILTGGNAVEEWAW